jgi:hypothetical protein
MEFFHLQVKEMTLLIKEVPLKLESKVDELAKLEDSDEEE